MAFKLIRFIRRRNIRIDAGLFSDPSDVHDAFRKALGREDYVGSNLDALHDVLTTTFSFTTIRVITFGTAREKLGDYADSLKNVLVDSAAENRCLRVEISE